MTDQDLINWIETNCFDVKGNLNSKTINESWWSNRNYIPILSRIREDTKFLNNFYSENITQRLYHLIKKLNQIQTCYCGNPVNFIQFKKGYHEYCSIQCATSSQKRNQKIKDTIKNIDGFYDKINDKVRKTNLEKYGVEWTTQVESVKEKSSQTKQKRYNNQHFNNIDQIKKTNLEKYGVEYTTQVDNIKSKIREAKIKSGIIYPIDFDKDWLVEQNKTKNIAEIASDVDRTYHAVYLWFKKNNIDFITHYDNNSKPQSEINSWLNGLYINTIYNDRTFISPQELDIFIPDKKLAIELNGCYWHSNDKKRHLNKLNSCDKIGIKLLQFWDIEWQNKPLICQSIIKAKLNLNQKIYARKCSFEEIDTKTYHDFMEANHIQGSAGASIKFGLFYDDNLVSAIGFGKSRFNKSYDYEIIRFANILNFNVVGGFSKLLKNSKLNNIISYSDRRLFDGLIYQKSGFTFVGNSDPGYFWYKSGNTLNRYSTQKHKLKNLLKNFDPNLSEAQNMERNNWRKVFDCGNSVWSYHV